MQSKALLEAGEGVTVQTESGIEALSEGFLEAEAQSEAKMVAQQEAQLAEENKMRESEKHKFLDIVSAKERQSLAQDKAEAGQAAKKEAFKPVTFENFDALTGKPAELKNMSSLTPMELEKMHKA